MSVATVKAVVREFIRADKSRVLVLKGAWGVGKTHLWKALKDELVAEATPRKYAYASLFGISSLAELREALVFKLQSLDRDKSGKDKLFENFQNWLSTNSSWKQIPYIKNISIGVDAIASLYIRDAIICLDDFERCSKSIKSDELLGFISELKEERNCKVVLIMNEEKLDDGIKDTYATYREKVVDIDLLFEPTVDEAIEIAIPKAVPSRDLLVQCCGNLSIKNIRVLRRIVDFVEVAHGRYGRLHPRVVEQAVATITLFAWAFFDRDGDKPDVDYIRNWNRIGSYLESKGKKEDNPAHAKWRALLQSYGFGFVDEFDKALIELIERGHLEGTSADEMALEVDKQAKLGDLDGNLNRAWKKFRDSFDDNEDEFVGDVHESTKQFLDHISVGNLNGSVSLLRQLGRDDLADDLIAGYVRAHQNSGPGPFITHDAFVRDLDPALRGCLGAELAKVKMLPTLRESLLKIARDRAWSTEHTQALEAASVDDFFVLFTSEKTELAVLIACALQLNYVSAEPSVPEKAKEALERIAKTSRFNAVRVRAYLG